MSAMPAPQPADTGACDLPAPRPGWPGAVALDAPAQALLQALHERYGHDFRRYAASSVQRRLAQAMAVMGCRSIAQLSERVLRDGREYDRLLQYLTVQVTELFRDPGYYRLLREHLFPWLQAQRHARLWVAGCSSGEEAWSLAILLHEAGLLARCRIYATDINRQALDLAAQGVLPVERLAGWQSAYRAAGGRGQLADHLQPIEGGTRHALRAELMRPLVVAEHDLAHDGAFIDVHAVSCRNVLIYFDPGLRGRVLALFHETLVPDGFLGLGNREALRPGEPFTAHAVGTDGARLYRRSCLSGAKP